jgi:hypothetical protein
MEEEIINLKWSNGENYDRSKKSDKDKYINDTKLNEKKLDENECSIEEQVIEYHRHKQSGDKQYKREENSDRLKGRELSIQSSMNPFLGSQNYIEDIISQDEFLRPKNSNYT